MTKWTALAIGVALLLPLTLVGAPTTLTLLPGPDLAGPAGGSVGWGYTLTNGDADNWLIVSDVSFSGVAAGDSFTDLMSGAFPALEPGGTRTVPFDPANPTAGLGIYDIGTGYPLDALITGDIFVDYDLYSNPEGTGDPVGGSIGPIAVSITVNAEAPQTVPEPATGLLVAALLGLAAIARQRIPRLGR
jgi:hypothetical protein